MARPAKIVQLGLEADALRCRAEGLTLEITVARLNRLLKERGSDASVSRNALTRYYATLDWSAVGVVHRPQVADENANLAATFAEHYSQVHGPAA